MGTGLGPGLPAVGTRLDAIEAEVDGRARFRTEDFAMAGCIATIGRDSTLQVIQGLVRPKDMPKETGTKANGHCTHHRTGREYAVEPATISPEYRGI